MPLAEAGAAVEVDGLTWLPHDREEPVLRDVSFRLAPGERVLLAGASGSGKSTLLRAIAGLLDPEDGALQGRVVLEGRSGLLLQDPRDAQVAERAGRDTAFGLENARVPPGSMPAAVARAHDSVGFPYGPIRRVQALSGGEAQRLALAGVLVFEPGLVLLDEPTAMLDPVSAAGVRAAVSSAAERSGATVLLAEHRSEQWDSFVRRALLLDHDGRLIHDGPVSAMPAVAGVWGAGAAAPRPLPVAAELVAPVAHRAAPGAVVLRAEAVSVSRSPSAPGVLRDVDLAVRSGRILAVRGPSGAGKTTLTGVLAGLTEPDAGRVTLLPSTAAAAPPAALSSLALAGLLGWVPQEPELAVVARTVLDEVRATSRALGRPDDDRAERLLAVLGLRDLREDPHLLSGGEQRRLALAAALAHGPAVLLLDEPTVGQDPQTWSAVAGVLVAARAAGTAVVVATHDPLLADLADDELVLPPRPPETEPGPPPGRPLGARSGPLALLLAGMLLLFGSAGVADVRSGAAGLALEVALAPLVLGRQIAWRRFLPGLVAVASIGVSTLLLGVRHDLLTALTAAFRIAFFVLPGVALAAFVDPSALGDALGQRLRLPARPVVAATAAWLRFEQLAGTWRQLRGVRRIRGLGAGRGPVDRIREGAAVSGALLVATLRQAARMALAMEARGFGDAVRRTWAEPAPWRAADTVLVLVGAAVAAVPALVALTA